MSTLGFSSFPPVHSRMLRLINNYMLSINTLDVLKILILHSLYYSTEKRNEAIFFSFWWSMLWPSTNIYPLISFLFFLMQCCSYVLILFKQHWRYFTVLLCLFICGCMSALVAQIIGNSSQILAFTVTSF